MPRVLIPNGGNTINQWIFKAGTPRLWIKSRFEALAFALTDNVGVVAPDASSTSMDGTTTSSPIFAVGDILINGATREKVIVTVATPGTPDNYTIARSVDNTIAQAMATGDPLCKVADGMVVSGGYTQFATDITVVSDALAVLHLATGQVMFRREYGTGADRERLLVTATDTQVLTTVRDINLHKGNEQKDYAILTDEVLIRVQNAVLHPYSIANRDKWHEIESIDGVEIPNDFTAIPTLSDQRGDGPNFFDRLAKTLVFTCPITAVDFLGYLDPTNSVLTQNSLREGFSLDGAPGGIELQGVQFAIMGQETSQQELAWIHEASITDRGSIAYNKAQRTIQWTFSLAVNRVMGSKGAMTGPLPCVA